MAKHLITPVDQVDWGSTERYPSGSKPIADDDVGTYQYYSNGGSVAVFPEPTMPSGPVIAVAVQYQQSNGGVFNLYNGWVEAFLLYDGVREPASRSYVQDGFSSSARTLTGPPVYRPGMEPWSAEEIRKIDASVGSATGPIGPVTNRRWCRCNGASLVLYTADPVPVPTEARPGNSTTETTSSVNFSAKLSNLQQAQPARAVFQVARDTGFTVDVRTFVGDLNAPSSDGGQVISRYVSKVGTDSWTDLGPGIWHLRVKGRDFLGNESAWSSRTSFTINNAPLPTPVLVTPANGEAVSSPYATRGVLLPGDPQNPVFPGGVRVGIRWQFSTSSSFSSNVIEWLNLDGRFDSGSVTYDPTPSNIEPGRNGQRVSYLDPSQYLSQGVQWYARARAEDKYGQSGPWSTVAPFTVSHPPTVTPVYPMGGEHFDPVGGLVEWDFMDPWGNDTQAGYEVRVIDAASNSVYATGYVLSSLTSAVVEIPTSYLDTKLRWRARLRDRDGVTGNWSAYQEFTYVRRPAVVITSPADASYVEAGQPLIEWDRVFHPGATQTGYQVLVLDVETRATVYDSGYVIDNSSSSHAVRGTYLDNMRNYEVTVRISDSNGLRGDHRVTFTTNFTMPPTVSATASPLMYESDGYVRILWDGPVDPLFESWRVYRRPTDSPEWTLAAESSDVSVREAKDWTASSTGTYIYSVVQVASRHGALVEGSKEFESAPVRLVSSGYWLVVPELDLGLRVVPASDSFERERESSSMVIIGRGRKMNFGSSISREGSLSIPVRGNNRGMTGSELMAQVDLLVTGVTGVYLRDPFGNYFPVALGRYSFERMAGVGSEEMGELEVPYVEVAL